MIHVRRAEEEKNVPFLVPNVLSKVLKLIFVHELGHYIFLATPWDLTLLTGHPDSTCLAWI